LLSWTLGIVVFQTDDPELAATVRGLSFAGRGLIGYGRAWWRERAVFLPGMPVAGAFK
jgi:hypothetical protein